MEGNQLLYCPENRQHILRNISKFRSHVFKCKDLKGRTFFFCRFFFPHQFKSREEKDLHEEGCAFNLGRELKLERVNDEITYKGDSKVATQFSKHQENWWSKNSHLLEKQKEEKLLRDRLKEEMREETDEMIKVFEENYSRFSFDKSRIYDFGDESGVSEFCVMRNGRRKLQQVLIEVEEFVPLDSLKEAFNMNVTLEEFNDEFGGEFTRLRNNPQSQILDNRITSELKSGLVVGVNRKGLGFHETLVIINKNTHCFGKFVDILCSFAIIILSTSEKPFQQSYWFSTCSFKPEDLPLITNINEEEFKLREMIRVTEIMILDVDRIDKKQPEYENIEFQRNKKLIEETKTRIRKLENLIAQEKSQDQGLDKMWNEIRENAKAELKSRINESKDELNNKFNNFKILENAKYIRDLDEQDEMDYDIEEARNRIQDLELKNKKFRDEHCSTKAEYEEICQETHVLLNKVKFMSATEIQAQPRPNVESSKNRFKCLVCIKNKKEVVFLPCRHLSICKECYEIFIAVKMKYCPICLSTIKAKYAPITCFLDEDEESEIN